MGLRLTVWSAFGLAVFAVAATSALASRHAKPKLVGDWKAGMTTFVPTCGVCHRLKLAGSTGTVGPNLDRVRLTQAQIVKAILKGGASVMDPAQAARYPTDGPAYRGALTTKQVRDLAAFVYVATRAPA